LFLFVVVGSAATSLPVEPAVAGFCVHRARSLGAIGWAQRTLTAGLTIERIELERRTSKFVTSLLAD
jgi:hypothetical protein